MKKFPWVNEKGQEFEPFKMLIFVIMAFVMLFFILSSLNYFEGQKVSISRTQLLNGLKSAAEAPQVINKEKPLRLRELFFDTGVFSSRALAEFFALGGEECELGGEECVNLYARPTSPAFEMKQNERDQNFKLLSINQKIQSDVFIYCSIPTADSAQQCCVVACNIYFGIMPTEFERLSVPPAEEIPETLA